MAVYSIKNTPFKMSLVVELEIEFRNKIVFGCIMLLIGYCPTVQ